MPVWPPRVRAQVLSLIGEPRQVLRLPGAARLAGLCVAERQVTWTGKRPQVQAFLYAVDLDGGRVHELAIAGRTPSPGPPPSGAATGPHPPPMDDETDVRPLGAPDRGPLSAPMRAARAARAAVAAEGREGEVARRAPKLRERNRLLAQVSRHPRGDIERDQLLQTFELPPNATEAAVDHAIRFAMRVLHPDYTINHEAKGGRLGKELEAAFHRVCDLRDRRQLEREQQRAEPEEAEQRRR